MIFGYTTILSHGMIKLSYHITIWSHTMNTKYTYLLIKGALKSSTNEQNGLVNWTVLTAKMNAIKSALGLHPFNTQRILKKAACKEYFNDQQGTIFTTDNRGDKHIGFTDAMFVVSCDMQAFYIGLFKFGDNHDQGSFTYLALHQACSDSFLSDYQSRCFELDKLDLKERTRREVEMIEDIESIKKGA